MEGPLTERQAALVGNLHRTRTLLTEHVSKMDAERVTAFLYACSLGHIHTIRKVRPASPVSPAPACTFLLFTHYTFSDTLHIHITHFQTNFDFNSCCLRQHGGCSDPPRQISVSIAGDWSSRSEGVGGPRVSRSRGLTEFLAPPSKRVYKPR